MVDSDKQKYFLRTTPTIDGLYAASKIFIKAQEEPPDFLSPTKQILSYVSSTKPGSLF